MSSNPILGTQNLLCSQAIVRAQVQLLRHANGDIMQAVQQSQRLNLRLARRERCEGS